MLTFAWDNAKLINLLRQRGTFIKFEKYDKMREVDEKINEFKKANHEDVSRPVTAFLTFENEEGFNRAKNYNEAVLNDENFAEYRTLLGEQINIEEASEPTDIIWENRHFTSWDRLIRTIYVVCVVAVLLFISFMLIFMCSKKSVEGVLKYPKVDCKLEF